MALSDNLVTLLEHLKRHLARLEALAQRTPEEEAELEDLRQRIAVIEADGAA